MTNKNKNGKLIAKTNKKAGMVQAYYLNKNLYLLILVVLLLGFSLSLYFFNTTKQSENTHAREAFEIEALGDIYNAVVDRFDRDLSALEDIEAIFSASIEVTREEFRLFTAHELSEDRGIQALEWIPYVIHDEREKLESAARAEGLLDFTFTERLAQGEMVLRGEHDVYFPVYFVEPMEGNEAALGFDLASNSARLEAINLARDTGEMVSTSPITLVQEDGEQSGFIVFYPIYKPVLSIETVEGRRANLQGFALGVFRSKDLIESALEGLSQENIFLLVYDVDPTAGDILIFDQDSSSSFEHKKKSSHFIISKLMILAGRTYRLEFHSGDGFEQKFLTNTPIILLSSGIMLTIVMAFYIFSTEKKSILLRAQEARLRHLFENAPDAMVIFTSEGKITMVNQLAEKLFHYSRNELEGHYFESLFQENMGKLFSRNSFDGVTKKDTQFDAIAVRKDGNEFPVAVKINSVELEGQHLNSSSIRDLTEFRESQLALVESEDKYRAIFEHSSDMIQSVRLDATFVFVNEVWLKTLGYREDEAKNLTLWDIIHPDSLEHCKMAFYQALEGKTIEKFEVAFLRKNGDRIQVEGNITPRIEDGVISSTHVFCRDVTERYEIEAKIKLIVEDLTQLIDTANALIVIFDAEGRITEWNRACVESIGYSKEEMLGKTLPHLFPEKVRSDQTEIIRGLQKGKTLSGMRLIIKTFKGEEKVFSVNANPRFDESNNIVGALAVGQDITELDKYRSSLEILVEEQTIDLSNALEVVQEADRLKSEFLSTAAHELRTPLTSIQGFSELLLTRKLNKERQTRYLKMINDQSTNLGQIIDDLLDLSRLEAGRGLEVSKVPIDIISLTEEIISEWVEFSPLHTLKFIKPKDPISVIGDPNRLMQVAQNLVSNAIKYSPEGGEVLIVYEISDDYLLFYVRDEGIGMSPAQLEHLFEKFYRGDASNTSIGGTGLGLAITKSIVELHDGEIWVESEYNKGTTFFVRLPLAKETNSEDHK